MKRSRAVVLVLSGGVLVGCGKATAPGYSSSWSTNDLTREQVLTNNTYVEGRGYYHAPYHAYFPYPYNYFVPGFGYYHGGRYTAAPYQSSLSASRPGRSYYQAENGQPRSDANTTRGGFTRSRSSWTSGGS